MKGKKSGAVAIFIGALLIVIFVVGRILKDNPTALLQKYRYDLSVEHFGWLCSKIWLPAGVVGFPLFIISLVRSLVREKKERDKENES